MRRTIGAVALVVLAAGCTGAPGAGGSTSPPPETPSAIGVPVGTPTSYQPDVAAPEVPPQALVPNGATVSDVWFASASWGSSILVTFERPSDDPLHRQRGLVVWRRFPGTADAWRPMFGLRDPASRGVIQIRATIGDVTGDGSPDALTFEDAGGSGVCGTWRVIDLAANASVFERKTCDTTIDLSADPAGLVVREAVYAAGDAHCCPSATRVSVLTYHAPSTWTTATSTVEPT